MVPAFALAVLQPPPDPQKGSDFAAVLAVMGEYYRVATPWLLGAALLQIIGTLAMLALFTDPNRPTVGEAIRRSFARTPAVVGGQLIVGGAICSMVLLPVALGGATKNPVVLILTLLIAVGLGFWAWVRTSLLAPAVMVESIANPLKALEQSWRLTEGNALRLLAFYMLLGIAFLVVMMIGEAATRLVLTLVLGTEGGNVAADLVGCLFQAAMAVYFAAAVAAVHRQLASSLR